MHIHFLIKEYIGKLVDNKMFASSSEYKTLNYTKQCTNRTTDKTCNVMKQ